MPERNASREIKIRNSIHSLSHIFFSNLNFSYWKILSERKMEKSSKRTIVTHHHYPLALRQHDQCKYHETIARRKSKQGEYRGAIEEKLDWIYKNSISKLISILSSLNYPPLCINTAILPLLPLFLKYSSLPSKRENRCNTFVDSI